MAKEIKFISGGYLAQASTIYTVPAGKIAKIKILGFENDNFHSSYPSYFYTGASYVAPKSVFMCPYNIKNISQAEASAITGTGANATLDIDSGYLSYKWDSHTTMANVSAINAREIIAGPGETLNYYYEHTSYDVVSWSFMIIEEDLGVQ